MESLIPPGVSEHGYEFPPTRLAMLSRADVVVLVGLGLEPQIEKFLAEHPRPGRRVVVLADAADIKTQPHDHHDHDHAPGEECNHGAADPHIWLDPVLVEKMIPAIARQVRAALGDDPAAAARLAEAERVIAQRVREVDENYRRTLAAAKRRTLVVGHDAWGHLADRYNLKTVAIKGLTASEPTPAGLAAAIRAIKESGAAVVFVEPQLDQAAARRIAQSTGVSVRVLDPLGDGDWFKMMNANLKEIAAGLGVPEEPSVPR